jgi:hypothetical protein
MNMGELLAREAELTDSARNDYGPYFATAMHCCGYLTTQITRIDDDRFLFRAMNALVGKHAILATLSYVRRHRVQGSMNMRQVVESTQRACYFLARPKDHVRETEATFEIDETGVRDNTYRFFNDEMGDHAEAFKTAKKVINMTDAHASLRSAQLIARRSATGGDLFFDADNPVLVRVGLWSVINTTVGVLDAYHLVAQRYGGIRFADDFGDVFAAIVAMRDRLHGELWKQEEVQELERVASENAEASTTTDR